MKRYKHTTVGKNSALALALEKSEEEAAKVYKETTERYEKMYSLEDRIYFATKHKENL
jgi:uncharacterized lipoprotein YehR (DUF1307 family)